MSQGAPEEKNPASKIIHFEITELDDLDLDSVTGGIASEPGGGETNVNCVWSCTTNVCKP